MAYYRGWGPVWPILAALDQLVSYGDEREATGGHCALGKGRARRATSRRLAVVQSAPPFV
jgi:hypothetical protein